MAGLTEEEREAKRRRRHRRERRRKKRLIKEAEAAREEKLVEAINLEMKYGCTGFLSKSTRKTIKKRGGPLRVQEKALRAPYYNMIYYNMISTNII